MKIDTDTAEGKAELQKLIEAETKGLKDKNSELLGDIKKVNSNYKTIQDQLDAIKAEKDKADEELANKSGDADKIRATLETKYGKIVGDLEAKLTAKDGTLNKLLVSNGLTEALTKAGVAPQFLDAAKSWIRENNKSEITEIDGMPVAKINGEDITEFVSKWSQGDSGKHFVAAPVNGGGGAHGANGPGKAQAEKADMAGGKAERNAALAQKYPELVNTK